MRTVVSNGRVTTHKDTRTATVGKRVGWIRKSQDKVVRGDRFLNRTVSEYGTQ
jgi:hypothetical protein